MPPPEALERFKRENPHLVNSDSSSSSDSDSSSEGGHQISNKFWVFVGVLALLSAGGAGWYVLRRGKSGCRGKAGVVPAGPTIGGSLDGPAGEPAAKRYLASMGSR